MLKFRLSVLRVVAREYGGRTIDNIIGNIEARIRYMENKQ